MSELEPNKFDRQTLPFEIEEVKPLKHERGLRFWGIFLAIMVSTFTSAMDLTAVSTALPVIVNDLDGTQFVWVGSAYALSSTAFLPMTGGFAELFGRRPAVFIALACFALGSVLCGASTSMNFLIAGRTVQGVGAGGILSVTQIILSDMVPLNERGTFNGLIALAWAIASFTGPVIGGGLAQHGAWRWLFYLNIFTSGLSAVIVLLFLKLPTPQGTFREKLRKMDWIGNFLVIASSSSCIIALTWGGVQFPWSSANVLIPLFVGAAGLIIFFIYEGMYATNPIVPYSLMSTRTGLSGYLQTFIAAILLIASIYYLPVYFQGCKGASPTGSGVDLFGLGFILAPVNLIAGLTITKTKAYRPQSYFGWSAIMVAAGLLSTLKADSPRSAMLGFEVIMGVGLGILTTSTYFPVLAPLPVSENAHALAFFTFTRNFGQVWGVTIGSTILQNYLSDHLPNDFLGRFPQGTAVAYSIIPIIGDLPPDLAEQTRVAFAGGLSRFWEVMIGIGGLGLLISLMMKHMKLHTMTDKEWSTESRDKKGVA
ncbi:iron permease [Infundibulicybe gibba]|nr:iron permease [Infundibulicybe gibba]